MSHLEPRPTAIVSSQSAFPGRAVLRTFVQVLVALPTFLFGLAGVLALVAQDAFAEYLPEGWVAWILGASLFSAALAALLSRIMAYPAVDAALRRFGLSSTPRVDR